MHSGRTIKKLVDLKSTSNLFDVILDVEEMQFCRIPGMKAHDVGGTSQNCSEYKENQKNGYIVDKVEPIYGTDGKDVYVAVRFAKYQHQVEYHPLKTMMEDIPSLAIDVIENQEKIEKELRTVKPQFAIKSYLQSIEFVTIQEVKSFNSKYFFVTFFTKQTLIYIFDMQNKI